MSGPEEKHGKEAASPVPEKPAEELSDEDLKKVSGGAFDAFRGVISPVRTGVNKFSPGDGPEPPTGIR